MFFGFWKSLKILFLVLEEKILSIKKSLKLKIEFDWLIRIK
jgi:hypothetical protein